MLRHKLAGALAFALIFGVSLSAQSSSDQQTSQQQATQDSQPQTPCPNASQPTCGPSGPTSGAPATISTSGPPATTNRAPQRILGIIPNFRAVSADTQLPPLSVNGKFKLFLKQNFDYSTLVWIGVGTGISQASDSPKELGQGAIGYGRRYWHGYADSIGSNFFTNFMLPSLFRQDPRYYSLGHGGVIRRTGYAVSRLFVIKSDAGNWQFNPNELLGNGMGAGLSNAYYPSSLRGWTRTYQRWAVQIGIDGGYNLLKEFWPSGSGSSKQSQNAHP